MKKYQRMYICPEGFAFCITGLVCMAGALALHWWILFIPFTCATLFTLWFFRDPERKVIKGENLVVSPADGKIVKCALVHYDGERWIQVSIFMSVFNVHVNRAPVSGTITEKKYNPGKFHMAHVEKSSLLNEQMSITIKNEKGPVVVKQIAGMIARRIVCRVNIGDAVTQSDRFGLIRFGSRVDVLLPSTVILKVVPGQAVKGGLSIIAEFGN